VPPEPLAGDAQDKFCRSASWLQTHGTNEQQRGEQRREESEEEHGFVFQMSKACALAQEARL
jgi:hypothetical protein